MEKIRHTFQQYYERILLRLKPFVVAKFIYLFLIILALYMVIEPAFSLLLYKKPHWSSDSSSGYEKTILVDLSSLQSRGGIFTVSYYLIDELSKKCPKWRFVLLHRECYDDYWKNIENGKNVDVLHMIGNNVAIMFFLLLNASFINSMLTEIIDSLPKGIKRFLGKIKFFLLYSRILPDADLFFDPVVTTPFNNFYLPRITLIHDMLYHDLPRYMPIAQYTKESTEAAARYSDAVITVSKFSQRRILEVLDIAKAKVHFVHTALAKRLRHSAAVDRKAILKKYGLEKNKYLVYPSCCWQHKNHNQLLQAFGKYLRQYNSDMKLVLMGSFPKKSAFILHDLADHVVITNYVDDDTFLVILEEASAVIQASLYEGFGMTILEGMDAGKPVAASRVASIPEIAEDAVLYFDPYDINDMCSAIHRITSDENLRKNLVEKGRKQVEKFSHKEKMIEEYVKILESVMQ